MTLAGPMQLFIPHNTVQLALIYCDLNFGSLGPLADNFHTFLQVEDLLSNFLWK